MGGKISNIIKKAKRGQNDFQLPILLNKVNSFGISS